MSLVDNLKTIIAQTAIVTNVCISRVKTLIQIQPLTSHVLVPILHYMRPGRISVIIGSPRFNLWQNLFFRA